MAIDARRALREGADDLTSMRGIVFLVAFAVFSTASLPIHQTLTRDLNQWFVDTTDVSQEEFPVPETPLALDLSLPELIAALAVIFVVAEILRLVVIRSFASDSDSIVPTEEVTDRLGMTMVVLLFTSLLVQVAVYGGLAVFILPGLIAAVLTIFVRQAIVLDGANPLGAFRRSISIVTANVVPVLLILVVLIVLSFLLGFPAGLLEPESALNPIVNTLLSTVATVYGIAVITRAYRHEMDEDIADPALDAEDLDDEAQAEEPTADDEFGAGGAP